MSGIAQRVSIVCAFRMVFEAFGARRSPLCDCDIYDNVHSRHTGTTVGNVIVLRDEPSAVQPEREGKGREAAEEAVSAERRRLFGRALCSGTVHARGPPHTHARLAAVASATEKHAAR